MEILSLISPEDRITKPGLYKISAEKYHSDPCALPSLSNSIAQTLLDISPRHAFTEHPRFGAAGQDIASKRLDLGTIAHTLMLKNGRDIEIIDAADFKTKAAKEQRDEARKAGRTPALKDQYETASEMVHAARLQLAKIPGAKTAFHEGEPEVVMVWDDEIGPTCRSMIDWLQIEEGVVWDYKTVARPPVPDMLARTVANLGYDFQGAFYTRGIERVIPDLAGRVKFRLVMQEIEPPYLLTVAELDGGFLTIGNRKVEAAIRMWARCIAENNWPGFPAQIVRLEYPQYAESQWIGREIAEADTDAFAQRLPFNPIDHRVANESFA